MPYKNPEKQKEAVRRAVARSRGITEGITSSPHVIPSAHENVIPATPPKATGITEGMTGYDTRYEGRNSVPMDDLDGHMRRSWAIILDMYQKDPEKVRRIVVPVCQLKDTIAGEERNAGDCTRWGCYGPTYTDIARILKLQ